MDSRPLISSISHRRTHRQEENISLSIIKMLQYSPNMFICSHLHEEDIFTFSILKKDSLGKDSFGRGTRRQQLSMSAEKKTKQKCSESKRRLLTTAFNSFLSRSLGKTEDQISKHLRDPTGLHSKWKHHVTFTGFCHHLFL